MHNITFISTVHKEIGKCNIDELYYINKKKALKLFFWKLLMKLIRFMNKQCFCLLESVIRNWKYPQFRDIASIPLLHMFLSLTMNYLILLKKIQNSLQKLRMAKID
jgi:hypothetical protein